MTESHFICPTDFNQGRNFDREACRRHCPCEVDFIGALVAGYQAEVRRNWERCLDMKWSMQDYVSGCHNADEDADRLDRNGHQYRLYLENIKKLAKFLTGKDEEYWAQFANSDFEELYDILSKEIRKHKGIGTTPFCAWAGTTASASRRSPLSTFMPGRSRARKHWSASLT